MSKIKYSGLDQYGAESFEQQQCRIPYIRQHLSCDVCLGDKRKDYHNCFVLYCGTQCAGVEGVKCWRNGTTERRCVCRMFQTSPTLSTVTMHVASQRDGVNAERKKRVYVGGQRQTERNTET